MATKKPIAYIDGNRREVSSAVLLDLHDVDILEAEIRGELDASRTIQSHLLIVSAQPRLHVMKPVTAVSI